MPWLVELSWLGKVGPVSTGTFPPVTVHKVWRKAIDRSFKQFHKVCSPWPTWGKVRVIVACTLFDANYCLLRPRARNRSSQQELPLTAAASSSRIAQQMKPLANSSLATSPVNPVCLVCGLGRTFGNLRGISTRRAGEPEQPRTAHDLQSCPLVTEHSFKEQACRKIYLKLSWLF